MRILVSPKYTAELTTIQNKEGKFFKGLIIGRVAEGETEYMVAVTEHGGIWYRGDWVKDRWQFLSEKAFTERFPKLANESLNAPWTVARANTIKECKTLIDRGIK